MSIFVSIAAYRDKELVPTLIDCVRRARWPHELHFGVCWQHAAEDEPLPDVAPARLSVIDVPWRESRGACWARAECMKLWDGEEFFLQLDSHHRFVQDWDAVLIDQAARTGAQRPLLSSYPAPYEPGAPLPETDVPTYLRFHSFMPGGIPLFVQEPMQDWRERTRPMRARFMGAGAMFTLGRFCADVPYDPELYFYGEESTLGARAFTYGYSLYHASVHAIWHQGSTHTRGRHWDDHVSEAGFAVTGNARDEASKARVRQFFADPYAGPFGCGHERSFADYETYAGVWLSRGYATPAARRGDEPPPPPPVAGKLKTWTVRIELEPGALPESALDRPAFWYVGFHDSEDTELARADAGAPEISRALGSGRIVIERQFRSDRAPKSWTVWPTDRRGRWLSKLSGPVDARISA